MNKEEAIKELELIAKVTMWNDRREAVEMAIEALHHVEAEEKGYCHRIIPSNIEVVVRCKDCRYFKKIAERSDSGLCHRDIVASAWKENGYCSRGERKQP